MSRFVSIIIFLNYCSYLFCGVVPHAIPKPPDTTSSLVVWAFVTILTTIVFLTWSLLAFVLRSVTKSISNISVECEARRRDNLAIIGTEVSFISSTIQNLNNVIIDLAEENGINGWKEELAIDLFEIVMRGHCQAKAFMLAESLRGNGSVEEIIVELEHKYKKITEDGRNILNHIIIKNSGSRLGYYLDDVLSKDGWQEFSNEYIRALVETHANSRDYYSIVNNAYNILWKKVLEIEQKIKGE